MCRLSDERYEFIKEEVVHLFEHYGVNCIPINGFELAYKLGIRLISYSTLLKTKRKAAMRISEDGFFLETVDEERIYYNDAKADENFARMNMTILHEIAHDPVQMGFRLLTYTSRHPATIQAECERRKSILSGKRRIDNDCG